MWQGESLFLIGRFPSMMQLTIRKIETGLELLTCLATARAQDEQTDGETSAAAVAQNLEDPNATLGQLSFPWDHVAY